MKHSIFQRFLFRRSTLNLYPQFNPDINVMDVSNKVKTYKNIFIWSAIES